MATNRHMRGPNYGRYSDPSDRAKTCVRENSAPSHTAEAGDNLGDNLTCFQVSPGVSVCRKPFGIARSGH
jgi:hypothetical protein